jgi:hypothetical protein
MATSGKGFGALPVSTINPSKIGAQATDVFDTAFRPLQWMHNPTEENFQQPENDAALFTLLEKLPRKGNAWTNPTMWWRVENRLNMFSALTVAMSNADTYINVAEPKLFKTGYIMFLPQTGEQLLVLEVDESYSNSWVNAASAPCNVKVDRSILAGPKLAAAIGSEVRAGVPLMGEFGAPKEGVVTIPGDPMYNFIQLFGLYISMSNMQKNSLMEGNYGTHEQLVRENEAYLSQQLQNTLLFGRRMSYNHNDEGMVYMTNGLIPQLKDNVLSVGGVGNTFTYANLSDFIDGTFESANSGSTKYIPCGEQLFVNLLNTARQESALVEGPVYNPAIGVDEFKFTTGGGKNITVAKMRFAFMGALKDWGCVLDLANIATGEYEGFGWRWYMDLEAPMQAITKKTDALVASTSVTVFDPSTCGVLKGGVTPLIANRTGLGIVENY